MAKKRGRKRKASREPAPQHELPGGFWRQVLAVLMIAAAIILVMTWFGSGGSLLNNIHSGATWLIGFAAYLIPVLLVYLAVMVFRSDDNRLPMVVWFASILMVIWCSGMTGIPTIGQANPTGGVVGEWLNGLVTQILNPGVAAFIYVVLIFLTGIFILQTNPITVFRAFFDMFKTTKKEEDMQNLSRARRAEKGESGMGELKVNLGDGSDAVAPAPKKKGLPFKVNNATEAKKPVAAPSPAPERALVSISDPNWKMPSLDILEKKASPADAGNHQQNAAIIKSTLQDFGINVEMDGANVGPRVTQYTMKPSSGVNLSKIAARDKELALNLAVESVRIEAPIPGTNLVGVEIPNVKAADVRLRAILESKEWKASQDPLTFAIGKDISGHAVVANLAKMPHLLIAGTTGSGKSVMTNTMIVSLLYRNAPSDLKLIVVDPKQVEMTQYQGIPHLLAPIITDTTKALSALKWAVAEMERRYKQMAEEGVKNIVSYNKKMAAGGQVTVKDADGNEQKHNDGKMPYIVIVIDEMSDLMMQAGKELEPPIVRIAQMGRAAGLHLVLATQKPIVKVVTSLIKTNVPARIAFAVQSTTDSIVMLDKAGAEKLLGQGDMLFLTPEMSGKPRRIQGAWVSDEEEEKVANFLKEQGPPDYNDEVTSQAVSIKGMGNDIGGSDLGEFGRKFDPNDPYVRKAVELSISKGEFATSMLQTHLGKGHGFVSGLAIWLENIGVIGPKNGNKPREVLIQTMDEFDQLAGL
ncbi:DNA translocase FtsK 4TM domain-containing protein [Candidatus Saccharibacteria bacterium]|nr:DNA translocase FtsK 4TM domain-containing protein [Candidatus Saccharibacteria bacterium]